MILAALFAGKLAVLAVVKLGGTTVGACKIGVVPTLGPLKMT